MAFIYADRVRETSTTTGTGTFTLAGAVTGFQTFAAIGNGNTCAYVIEGVDSNGTPSGEWECGIGTYTSSGTTLARTTVISSSNSNSAVTFSAGTKHVFVTLLSNQMFSAIELGAATDTTIARLAAGVVTIEGSVVDVRGYTTTATAVGTTTLTVSSTALQFFTGTTTQTVVLPVTSTLALGFTFKVVNNSTGEVTVQSSGANNILVMGPGSEADFVCILTSGTSAASWQALTRYQNTPIVSKSAAYTTVLSDSGKTILHPSADTTARTFTIDSNANVPYPLGTVLTFVNQASAGVMTIAITTDTMRLSSAGTTGSRTLAANGVATAIKVTSTEWIISGSGLT